jgi:hypothetical protein
VEKTTEARRDQEGRVEIPPRVKKGRTGVGVALVFLLMVLRAHLS